MYKFIFQPLLFLFDAEQIHRFICKLLKIGFRLPFIALFIKKIYSFEDKRLEREVFGLKFKNPVGLAAGFDKDAELIDELATLGFGFIEIGTLTPKAQTGNEKPRLFRLKKDQALINRMGFNNKGVENAIERLKKRKSNILVGGNIGKNKNTPNESAVEDYLICFESLFEYVDYFVVNVSSPNTPNLRALQEKEPLQKLLLTLQEKNQAKPKPKPILLKISPDLSFEQIDEVIEVVINTRIAGVIATNTTIERRELETPSDKIEKIGAGGLSGLPLKNRSTEVIRYLYEKSDAAFPIIGVGGIHSSVDTLEKLQAGASLVQLYTGFVYKGPGIVRRINKLLAKTPIKC